MWFSQILVQHCDHYTTLFPIHSGQSCRQNDKHHENLPVFQNGMCCVLFIFLSPTHLEQGCQLLIPHQVPSGIVQPQQEGNPSGSWSTMTLRISIHMVPQIFSESYIFFFQKAREGQFSTTSLSHPFKWGFKPSPFVWIGNLIFAWTIKTMIPFLHLSLFSCTYMYNVYI